MIWTDEMIEIAKRAMSQSGTIREAAEVMRADGHAVSTVGLESALKRRGLSARDYLHPAKAQAAAMAAGRAAHSGRAGGSVTAPEPVQRRMDEPVRVDATHGCSVNPFVRLPTLADLRRAVARGARPLADLAEELRTDAGTIGRLVAEGVAAGCPLVLDGGRVRDDSVSPPRAPEVHRVDLDSVGWLGLALISDTHIGHERAATGELTGFLRYAHARGVRHVLHAGDVLDGLYWHRSAHLEQVQVGLDRQIAEALEVLPSLQDTTYWLLSGNHERNSYWRAAGIDAVAALCHRARATGRDDLRAIGDTQGRLVFGEGEHEIRVEVAHVEKGAGAYALTYGLQGYVRSIEGGSKPHLLVAGHHHVYVQTWLRGIWCCMPGCWQYQTDYERTKALSPAVGGVIAWVRREPYAIQVAAEWHGHHAPEVEWEHVATQP